jgi:light-regulated signal transduction histidine kinase (bacteriophytochrome)
MVTACLDRLQKKYPDQLDWRAKQYMDFAIEGGLRAREVLAGLLEYSHVESPADPLGPIDMESALGKAVDNLAFHVSKENATVTHDPLPSVVAEDQKMVQVFQLLIDNAIKFHGPEHPRVHISSREGPNDWTFSVSDNGIGIDPAYKDKIFVLFQRLNPRDSYDGNGIGLSICRKIVEGQGGTVWSDSQVGKGTTFYFSVPKEKGTQA